MAYNDSKKNYNIELLRFIAACMVIMSHVYSLAAGRKDFLSQIMGEQFDGGSIAVSIFFAVSGYYTTKSVVHKEPNGAAYFKARAKRIFPCLWMGIILSVFVLGPIFTNLPLKSYFVNRATWLYFLNGLLIPVHNLPGVFEECIAMSTVNGALWTLSVEVICYAGLFLLYKLKLLKKEKVFLSIPLFLIFLILLIGAKNILHMEILLAMSRPVVSFYLAICLYIFFDRLIDKNICLFGGDILWL